MNALQVMDRYQKEVIQEIEFSVSAEATRALENK